MFTDTKLNEDYQSLKEQFLIDLIKNIKNEQFKTKEKQLREQLKKQINEGKLF